MHVFTKPASGWANLTETAKLTAPDGQASDCFGYSVAISGNTIVVGALDATVGGNTAEGAAYVFTEATAGWTGAPAETAKLTASDGVVGGYFGDAVAISGNTVVVGALDATVGSNATEGAAYVFAEPKLGWAGTLTQTAKLAPSDGAANDYFGYSLAISGNTVVVVARRTPRSAAMCTRERPTSFAAPAAGWTGTLPQSAKLTAADGAANNVFGWSVAVSGKTVAVRRRGPQSVVTASKGRFMSLPSLEPAGRTM